MSNGRLENPATVSSSDWFVSFDTESATPAGRSGQPAATAQSENLLMSDEDLRRLIPKNLVPPDLDAIARRTLGVALDSGPNRQPPADIRRDRMPRQPVFAATPTPTREEFAAWRRERIWRRVSNALIVVGCLCMAFFGWKAIQVRANRTQTAALAVAESAAAPQWQMKRVSEFKPGDTILAYNHQTGRTEYRRVLQTFERTSDHLRLLDVQSSDGKTQRMETTDEHPFWVPARDQYILANKLKPGEEFQSPAGGLLTLVASEREEHPEGVPVYNVEVEGDHNYFVAAGPDAEPMLAHNKCGPELPDWNGRRTFTDGDSGLKDHAARHSNLSPKEYLARGQKNVLNGKAVQGGKYTDAKYHIRKIGSDSFSMSITDRKGKILSIDTWMPDDGLLTKELLLRQFKKNGITAPNGFWDDL